MNVLSLSAALGLAVASALGAPHDPEQRLVALTAQLQRRPDDADLRVERARVHVALGDFAAARGDLDRALRAAPAHGAAWFCLAGLEWRAGNEVATLQACRRAAAAGVTAPGLTRLRARALARLGRAAEAAEAFAAAMATGRHEPEDWLERAAAHAAAGDVAAARRVLAEALHEHGPVVALVDAAVAHDVAAGEFAVALARLETLRPFLQRPTALHERRAEVFAHAGQPVAAARERAAARAAAASGDAALPDEPGELAARPGVALPAVSAGPASGPLQPPPPPQVLVPTGATWRYFDQGLLPALDWFLPTYDDSGWPSGPAQLGYGDGDEATIVQSGPATAVHPTTWFRHAFTVANPAALPSARVRVLCDDGVLVRLNGVEIGRWNLPVGLVLPTMPAAVAVAGVDENAFHVFAFDPALLVAGNNVLAVEVHQVGPTSSDVSFDLEMLGGPGPISVLRGPYLQNATPTSACVRWRTDQPTATKLWLGATAATLQPVVFDATLRTEHTASVVALPPASTWHYAIGDAGGVFPAVPPATLRTLPRGGVATPLRAVVLGDAGHGGAAQYQVRDAVATFTAAHPADAVLLLGDNAYPLGTDADYQTGVFDVYGQWLRTTCSWSALGNHDALSASTATQTGVYYDVFSLPRQGEAGGLPSGTEAYYSFDRGHVHFVCLDSVDSDRTATGAMMTWLQADLASTNARWLVAFFHHPPYSAGSHVSDNPLDSGGRMTDMRQVALPILEAAGVDLVLSGHSHAYERSFLLDGHYGVSGSLQPGMVLDRGDGAAAGDGAYGKRTGGLGPHQGAVYVVAGSAGTTGGGTLDHPAMHVSLDRLGAFVFDIDGDRLDARFVGVAGVEDQFTLHKRDARTLRRDQPRLSVSAGGRQDFALDAGPAHAGRYYLLAGATGTSPGVLLGGLAVPLNVDPWLSLSLALANTPVYPNSLGVLDATGRAAAALVLPPLNDPSLVGQALWHAYVVHDGQSFVHASNAVKMTFVP